MGFALIDELAGKGQTPVKRVECRSLIGRAVFENRTVELAKPQTFMNLSGEAVACLLAKENIDDASNDLIVISDEPMGFIGGSKKSKKGFDLTYAMISVKASGEGKGEIGPAAKIKWMESGAPAPVRYDNQIVWIENVTKTTTGD